MSDIIKVKNLSFGYSKELILKNVSFALPAGKFLAIAGPNGIGKTTLLNLLCGLLKAKTGRIVVDSKKIKSYSIRKLAQKIAVVHQDAGGVFDFTVEQTVAMGRTPYIPAFGFESAADLKITADAMEITDTAGFSSRPLANLSGGERQRVFIARALAQDSDILLLDEPTNFLDLKHQVKIYDLLKTAQLEKNKTIVAVTHDINLAAQYANIVLLLAANYEYTFGSSKEVFSPANIEKAFDVRAFAADVGLEKFFLPLGKFAKDSRLINENHRENQSC